MTHLQVSLQKRNITIMDSQNRIQITKVCIGCMVEKPLKEYHKDSRPSTTSLGVRARCKACVSLANASTDKISRRRNLGLKLRYNLSPKCFDTLMHTQDDQCKICSVHIDDYKKKYFAVDHNHETGEVRGLLCQRCNVLIGIANDSKTILSSAIEYLEDNGSYGQ